MRGVNKVILVGTLGADPDTKQFSNGGSITNISVATSEQWTDKQSGEKKESTEWHKVVFSGRLAEIAAQYLRKGSQVYLEGAIKTRKYQDSDGADRYITEIKAFTMQMLGGANGGQSNNNQASAQSNNNQYAQNNTANQYAQNQNNNQYAQNNAAPNNAAQPNINHSVQPPNPNQPSDDDIPF